MGIGWEVTASGAAGLVAAAGPGLFTVSEPGACKSAAVRSTFNCVVLTKVVGRAEAFHCTTELASNPVPVTVMVAAWPAGTMDGATEVMAGTGLFTEKLTGAEVPPPGAGFTTVNCATAPPERRDEVTVAVMLVEEFNVEVRVVPFHCTVELEIKPVPVMETGVSGEPAATEAGATAVIEGVGLEFGGGFGEAVEPPPQPDNRGMNSRRDAVRKGVARVMRFFGR